MAHQKNIIEAGKPLKEAKKALIMFHGRGASANDILSLKEYLPVDDFYIAAPQATNFTWYPYSFMAPVPQNEPHRVVADAELANELFGHRVQVVHGQSSEGDYLVDNPNRRCPDITKARTELAYHPRVTLGEGLRRTMLWYSGNRGGEER